MSSAPTMSRMALTTSRPAKNTRTRLRSVRRSCVNDSPQNRSYHVPTAAKPQKDQGGAMSSELDRLDRVDNPSLRVSHHVPALTVPDVAHLGQKAFCIFASVELQVDQDVVRVLDRTHYLISTNTRTLAISGIAVESPLPAGEV